MQVSEKYWRKTYIGGRLNLFPGYLGEFLKRTTPTELIRAENFLPHIFRRWYFLVSETDDNATPCEYLNWRREVENWPKEGQFFPEVKISYQDKKLRIDVTVSYISFWEQPLLIDIRRSLAGGALIYKYDSSYTSLIQDIVSLIKPAKIISRENITGDKKLLLHTIFSLLLENWRSGDPIITECFTQREWYNFWKKILAEADTYLGIDTAQILDRFLEKVRKAYPDYGIDSKMMKEKLYKKAKFDQQLSAYYFWLAFDMHFIVPLSLYLHLISPIFIEWENFRRDVYEILERDFLDPMPLYGPCTAFKISPFGRFFLKNI